jgi:hypothetical protein
MLSIRREADRDAEVAEEVLHAHAEGLVVAAHSAAGKRACGDDDVAARKQIRAGVRQVITCAAAAPIGEKGGSGIPDDPEGGWPPVANRTRRRRGAHTSTARSGCGHRGQPGC